MMNHLLCTGIVLSTGSIKPINKNLSWGIKPLMIYRYKPQEFCIKSINV